MYIISRVGRVVACVQQVARRYSSTEQSDEVGTSMVFLVFPHVNNTKKVMNDVFRVTARRMMVGAAATAVVRG